MKDALYKILNKCADDDIEITEQISKQEVTDIMKKFRSETAERKKVKKIKPAAFLIIAAAAVTCFGTTAFAAAELFSSIKKTFDSKENNALIATEPSEYAFIPVVEPIVSDGVTVSITEAMADNSSAFVFMDLFFENGVPEEILNDKSNNYDNVGFENTGGETCAVGGSKCISADRNTVSLYVSAKDITEKDWLNDGITVSIENFGYFVKSDKLFWDFETVANVSGTVTIPPEQVKYNAAEIAYADIDGVQAKMELSLLGFNVIFDTEEDFGKAEDKICYKHVLSPKQVCVFTNEENISGKNILGSLSAGFNEDGTFYQHFGFNIPVDIENIDKISLGGYEFCFE